MFEPYIKNGVLFVGDIVSKTFGDFQPKLISGENLKSINGISLLGKGNIDIKGGGGSNSQQVLSLLGTDGIKAYAQSLNGEQILSLENYPYSNKTGDKYCFRCTIDTFDSITIYSGNGTYGNSVTIDSTNITMKNGNVYPHGLNISTFLYVVIDIATDTTANIYLDTIDGMFTKTGVSWKNVTGLKWVEANNSALTDCHFSAINPYFKSPLWVFGASYESIGDSARWTNYIRTNMGYKNWLFNGYSGRNSSLCYDDLIRALNFGTPKYLFWTMWGNGTASSLQTYFDKVYTLCKEKGIELIIVKRANTPKATEYNARNAAVEAMIAKGVRYVDEATAVSPNPSDPNGCYDGYIYTDGVHPTALGAKAIAMQILLDLPEIMQY